MSPTPGSRGLLRSRSLEAIDDLTAAAREAFGARGYEVTTLDEIAAQAGRTKGTVYHHFPTKLALFEQVFVEEQRRLVRACAEAGARRRDTAAALKAGIARYLEEVGDPAVARITLVDGPTALGWERWRTCDDSSFRSMLVATLEQLAAEGRLRGYDIEVLADMLLGAITEVALAIAHARPSEQRIPQRAKQVSRLVDRVVDARSR